MNNVGFCPLCTLSSQVRTESLYGTNLFLFFPAPCSAKAEMTRPRVLRDLKETERGRAGMTDWSIYENYEKRTYQN